jgi:hypothetical protein
MSDIKNILHNLLSDAIHYEFNTKSVRGGIADGAFIKDGKCEGPQCPRVLVSVRALLPFCIPLIGIRV